MISGETPEQKIGSFMDGNSFEAQLFQCVAYVTHKCPLLQKLFLKWVGLTQKQRLILNFVLYKLLPQEKNDIYTPILSGFQYWNIIQDTEGACGYHDNPLNFKITVEDEKKIYGIIVALGHIIHALIYKQLVCEEINDFNLSQLKMISKGNHRRQIPSSAGDK